MAQDSRSFCLSREKVTMQQLNSRLALYLQQVKCLEEANQRLEYQIQMELYRKCPRELRELDRHLRTVFLLQDKISDGLLAQAQVKLQLLNAELTVFNLNVRCEKEREHRNSLEVELSNLRLLGEELQVHRLPELQSLLNSQTQQLMELQIQHKKEMQGLLAQMSQGVTVKMQPTETLDLIRQLDDLRQTNVALLNQNQCWFNNKVPMMTSPEVTFNPETEIMQAELTELRTIAASLEEELIQLQAQNGMLEASGLDQNESCLMFLQQTADLLCMDLDSVLQAAAQQAADYQNLLDVKTRLEIEIQVYRRLLDGLNPLGVSGLHPNCVVNVTPVCVATSPSAFRRNITVNKAVSVHGGNLRMMEVQALSRDHIRPIGHTSVDFPSLATVATVKSINVSDKYPDISAVTSIDTSNLRGSFHKSENLRTGSLPETTWRESMAISNCQGEVHVEVSDLQNSLVVSPHISLDKAAAVKASITEINTAQSVTTKVPGTQLIRSAAVQAKPETFTSKQTSSTAGLQANIQTKMTKTILCAEPEVKTHDHAQVSKSADAGFSTGLTGRPDSNDNLQSETTQEIIKMVPDTQSTSSAAVQGKPETFTSKQTTTQSDLCGNKTESIFEKLMTTTTFSVEPEVKRGQHFVTHTVITEPSKEAAAEVQTQTETVMGFDLTKNEDPARVVSLCLETQGEDVRDAKEDAMTASVVSGSHVLRSEEAQCTVSGNLMQEKDIKRQEEQDERVEGTLSVGDQNSASSDTSDREQNNVMEDEGTGSGGAQASSGSPDFNDNNESKTEIKSASSAAVQAKPETFPSKQTTTQADLCGNKTESIFEKLMTTTTFSAEPEHFVTHTALTECSKEAAAEVQTETETVISAQMICTECPVQAKNQDPAQVVSLCLETPGEDVRDADEDAMTSSVVSGSHVLRFEEALVKVSGELTLIVNKDTERQEKKEEEGIEDTLSFLDQSSALSNASNSEQNKVMKDADTVLVTTESKTSPCQTDSGVGLSSSYTEELLHQGGGHLFVNPAEPVTCLSPAQPEVSLSPNEEEEDEEEACLTEASALVRPVKKYILSTRDEGQSLSLSRDQALEKVSVSVRDGDRLCFGTFKGKKESKGTLSGTTNVKLTTYTSGGMVTSKSVMASGLPAGLVGLAANSSCAVSSRADTDTPTGTQGTIRYHWGEWRVYEGILGQTSNTGSKGNLEGAMLPAASQQETRRFNRRTRGEWKGPGLPGKGKEDDASVATNPREGGRFGSGGSEDWIVYSGSLGRKRSLYRTRSEESSSAAMLPATSLPEMRKYGSAEGGEWMGSGSKCSSSLASSDSLPNIESREILPTSPPGSGKFGGRGSGEWRVYGGSSGRMSSWDGSKGLPSVDKEEKTSVAAQATSPPGSLGTGRFGGSGEWRVYGGSSGRLSSASSADRISERISSPSSHSKLNSAGSGGRLSSGSVVRRSSSVGSGGNLFSSGSGGKLSSSSRNQRTSASGRFTSTGSGEWKPVYSLNSGPKSTAGGSISSQRSGNYPGSGSKLSTGNGSDRISCRPGGRISSSSGSGRPNSMGGRVISSSDRPIRSTGSGAGGNKERISVCKMAALSISAAGRERSLDRERQAQRLRQQQAAATSPFLQRWLTSGADVKGVDPEGPDDIMHL